MSTTTFFLSRFSIPWLLVLVLFSSLATAQWRGADRPKLVVVERLSFEYESTVIEAVGTAQAKRSVTLFPSVSDEVTSVRFRPGQSVNANDVLISLDSRLQDINLKRTLIQLQDAQRTFKRVQQSVAKGAVTERELDDVETAVKLAEVAHQEAQKNKEDRLVRAPFSGVVGLSDVEVGDRISPQTEITTIDDRESLFVNFTAPELAVAYLMKKPDVRLQPWTDRNISLTAKIAELDSRVNIQDRTIRVRALLENEFDQYLPGMSFRVTISVQGERYVAIPEAALSWGANGAFVWLASENKATRVQVNVEQRLRGRILVSGALSDGEILIVEGIQSLRDGQVLNIQNASEVGLPETRVSKTKSTQEVAG
ncbi:MAG: RND family efflux transporter MFP subunit [Alphaproteobacteria bacterium]|jgi:RND family efflux transporter MFP subunit